MNPRFDGAQSNLVLNQAAEVREDEKIEQIEVRLLLEAIFQQYGYDFREFAESTILRRVRTRLQEEKLSSVSALQERVLRDPAWMEKLLIDFSVSYTIMFRNPSFYRAFRRKIVPVLKTYPFVRIWHAGCSTGQEVYSMAILLHEEGLYEKCRIYATDFNELVLMKGKDGIYSIDEMKLNTQNYIESGGEREFSDYYTARYDSVRFKSSLIRNVVFAQHNLVTDRSFNEFNVILCRNVLIYFKRSLQNRVFSLLYDSLPTFGILCLGDKESTSLSECEAYFEAIDAEQKIYRKIR